MARAPVAGRVKTRIARELGVAAALRFARHNAASLLQRLAGDARWDTRLALTPDTAPCRRLMPRGAPIVPQGAGDLGARMQRLIDRAPPGPVVIVGTDVPGIEPRHVAAAFRLLGRHDAVLGPAADGGYWCIGLREPDARLLHGVPMSVAHTLDAQRRRLQAHGVGFTEVDELLDVDTIADARAVAAQAPHTRFARLLATVDGAGRRAA
jgi:rSAM/selenodomain-associated transferase 1